MFHVLVAIDKTIRLTERSTTILGRSEECDYVLNDGLVSRRHAEITWTGGTFVLKDLGSNNGTKVDGSEITKHNLKDGDRVEIGGQTFIYRVVLTLDQLRESVKGLLTEAGAVATMSDSVPRSTSDFSGSLTKTAIWEVCQLIEIGEKTGVLELDSDSLGRATLYFKEGVIVGAEIAPRHGEDAARAAFKLEEGLFSFRHESEVSPELPFKTPVSSLLVAAMVERTKQEIELGRSLGSLDESQTQPS